MYAARPVVAFAAIGQGRLDGKISPEEESTVIGKLLSHWALESTLHSADRCGALRSTWIAADRRAPPRSDEIPGDRRDTSNVD
jgi:hypothetical protein